MEPEYAWPHFQALNNFAYPELEQLSPSLPIPLPKDSF
jgi:hypothetical protein